MAAPYASSIPAFMGGGAAPFTNALPIVLVDANGNPIGGTNPSGFSQLTNAAGSGTVSVTVAGDIDVVPASGQDVEISAGLGLLVSSGNIAVGTGSIQTGIGLSILTTLTTQTSQRGVYAQITHDANVTTDAILYQGQQVLNAAATIARVGNFIAGIVTQNGATVTKFAGIGLDQQPAAFAPTNNWMGVELNDQSANIAAANVYGYHLVNIAGGSTQTIGHYIGAVSGTSLNQGIFVGAVSGGTTNQALVTTSGQVSATVTNTLASAAGLVWDGFVNPASTLTLTGSTNVTQSNPGLSSHTIYQPTIQSASALNVQLGAALVVQGAPLQGGAGPTTIINNAALALSTVGTTIRNTANTTYASLWIPAQTITLSTTTNVTSAAGIAGITIGIPTINQSGGAVTVTNAATLTIVGAVAAGASVTITNPYALLVAAGTAKFVGAVSMSSTVSLGNKITAYNNISTAGNGVGAIVAYTRPAQQVNSTVTLVTYATPASDGSYRVWVNLNVTVSTTVAMTVTCTYTDEANVARTLTLPFFLLAGTLVQSITTAQGNIAYESMPITLRVKASTTISLQTAGTVTAVTYTSEGFIEQVA